MDTDCVLLYLRNTTSEVGHGLRHQLFDDSTRSRGSPRKKCTAKYLRTKEDYWIFIPDADDWNWNSMNNS